MIFHQAKCTKWRNWRNASRWGCELKLPYFIRGVFVKRFPSNQSLTNHWLSHSMDYQIHKIRARRSWFVWIRCESPSEVLSKSYSTKTLLYFGPLELNEVSASVEWIQNPIAKSSFSRLTWVSRGATPCKNCMNLFHLQWRYNLAGGFNMFNQVNNSFHIHLTWGRL